MTDLPAGMRKARRTVRGWQIWALPRLARDYVLAVIGAAFGLAVLAAVRTRWHPYDLLAFATLLACGVATVESARTVREARGVLRDLQTVWYLAIAVALPPVYALAAPLPLGAYRLWRVRRSMVYRRVFSGATLSLAYGCASLIFHSAPGAIAGARPGAVPHAAVWTLVVAGCGAAAWVLNNGLLLGAIRAADPRARLTEMYLNRDALTSDLLELNLAVLASYLAAVAWYMPLLAVFPVAAYRRYLMTAQLVAQARTDAATGLLNAGTWQREAEVELARALRENTALAVAMAGIDRFGDVEDLTDPEVLDRLIPEVARTLTNLLDSPALVGRLGRDEFAILLPGAGDAEAQRISVRLRDHIAAEPVAIESGGQETFVFRLTVSIGVATLDESRRALPELIAAAGYALGQARSTGWSKVYLLPGSPGPGTTRPPPSSTATSSRPGPRPASGPG
jgi:diguanylate cyclase (GGDEF)-like protein